MTIGTSVALESVLSVNLLAEAIHEHCGIDYRDNLHSLHVKLSMRVKALGLSICQYLDYLERNPAEWDDLIEAITINETYFFREESQLEELVRVMLPVLENRQEIRIWSAACSTGEEPYSLAMAIMESGLVPLSRIQIYATDINKKVLSMAERGFYPRQSMCFRRTSDRMKAKYFDETVNGFQIKEQIRERVRFMHWNLLQDATGVLPKMDFIFCRNVLIYFDEAMIQKVITNLSNQLVKGGYLFLGHAETISGRFPEFRTVNASSTFYYQKEGRMA
jgi:chemotaxis protein methyltransferase CheR